MGGLLMKGKENLPAVRRRASNVAPLAENGQSRFVSEPKPEKIQEIEAEVEQSNAAGMDISDANSISSLNSTSKVRKERDEEEGVENSRKRIRVSSSRVRENALKRPCGEEISGSARKRARVGESPAETGGSSRRKRIDDLSGSSRKRAKVSIEVESKAAGGEECWRSRRRRIDRGVCIDEERVKKRRLDPGLKVADSRKRKREVSECDDEEDFGGTGVKPDFSSDSEIQERFAQSLSF